ncbi:MAG: methylated-DNA--[protein]-cysteine S-methyltransferase [Pseudoruegeria sp.]
MGFMSVETQFGPLGLVEEDDAIVRLLWERSETKDDSPLLREGCRQISAYSNGALEVFDLPLRVNGSEFQQMVCREMKAIPFGETVTYGDIAKRIGAPAQAIGRACGGNPIPVLIPCHRVMGAKGLTGFSGAGGVETKVALLRHEKAAGLLI